MNIKPDMNTMKNIAYQINSRPLPQIPLSNSSEPCLLLPQVENSLLKNNFHIYSEEILRKLKEGEQKHQVKDKKEKGKKSNLSRKRVSLMRSNQEDETTAVNKKSLIEENKDDEVSHVEKEPTIIKSNYEEDEDDENNDLNLNLPLVEDDYDF